jgi:hypothetical protein
MGRKPVDPPPRMRRILEKALHAGEPVTVDGVTLYPPRGDLRRWRVKVLHERRTFDKTYGAGLGYAHKGFLEADAWLVELKSGLSGRPEFESAPLAGFTDDYVGRRGKSGEWSRRRRSDASTSGRCARSPNGIG